MIKRAGEAAGSNAGVHRRRRRKAQLRTQHAQRLGPPAQAHLEDRSTPRCIRLMMEWMSHGTPYFDNLQNMPAPTPPPSRSPTRRPAEPRADDRKHVERYRGFVERQILC